MNKNNIFKALGIIFGLYLLARSELFGLYSVIFLLLLIALPIFLIRPNLLQAQVKKDLTRKTILKVFGLSFAAVLILLVSTTPSIKTGAKISAGLSINETAQNEPTTPISLPPLPEEVDKQNVLYKVIEVIDGDTIKVDMDGIPTKIRLLGIDTPETSDPSKPVECFGKEATEKVKDRLANQQIYLEADHSQGDKDKYGRLLRYVFLDQLNFNKWLIQEGFAYEYTYNAVYKYQQEFKQAQLDAQENQRGLWAKSTCDGSRPLNLKSNNVGNIENPAVNISDQSKPEFKNYLNDIAPTPEILIPVPQPTVSAGYQCGQKTKCGQMNSCQEAYFYLNTCGLSRLDGDNDGTPCESIC